MHPPLPLHSDGIATIVYPHKSTENKEKKLLDGFLAGRERLIEEVRKEDVQMRLFE